MTIEISVDNDVATITLDDGRANAINPDWMSQFLERLNEAEERAKAIVIAGRDGVFSGGFDLKWLPTASPQEVSGLLDRASEMTTRVYGSPRPIVAACTGHAMAMGMFLLMCCDTRIGAKGDFKFGANETMNNMDLPVFATELPRDRVDNRQLTKLLIQSYLFGPDEAVELGVIDAVEAPENVVAVAQQLAGQLAKLPGRAYANNKLAVRQGTIDKINAAIGSYGPPS